ncbi:MAG TPA: glycoside hydrolase domain-containing protein [Segeticoccus sp.]|uniref:glycoside hydrolase domain-containing protein n=1 Tax=Segeticoccus sp. TaxID=2706531 RepID=UPI002D7F0C97|nr:glycoside hydrolase domain-containing protein [Segeticoccus sp.]HET8600979.1 glycoside hydrolase domain-containing protein [Segeticoccus sp.]
MFRVLSILPAGLLVGSALVTSPTVGSAPVSISTTGPATAVHYAPAASARQFKGLAFDTCAAPSLATMKAWTGSPYRGVGAYIGGASRTCRQDNLTRDWVTGVTDLGWRILPIYKGLQPPCGARPTDPKISRDPATARAQGATAADDAVRAGTVLGMAGGSAFYNDIENYSTTDTTCRVAVLNYATGWTQRLHTRGYLSGVYVNLSSGTQHLSAAYSSPSYARPDAIWIARYDLDPALRGWAGVPDTQWPLGQRAKQYRGDHVESYGGVSMNIDSDQVYAPVATVPRTFRVTSSAALNGRSGPSTSYPVVETHQPGSAVSVACQAAGATVASTKVWDKLVSGAYVTDYYVSTPSQTTWSGGAPPCRYPYQVAPSTGVNTRSGPGTSYPVTGSLGAGALARVVCQRAGSMVGTTNVWDRLGDGSYVTDYYLATPSKTTYSSPLPRC